MAQYAFLISARADAAFFHRVEEVALAEASGVSGVQDLCLKQIGDMRFLQVTANPEVLPSLLRLSTVQGGFERQGNQLVPLDLTAGFALHPDFVWGEKYRGKTNETLTQLLINVGLQQFPQPPVSGLRLLDPMCGRGTTVLWAMRYGLNAVGIEQDGDALNDMRRGLKKWTKLHRQKHKLTDGWVQKANKKGVGKFLEFAAEGVSGRVIVGDSVQAHSLTQHRAHDLIVTDIPYGVQHMGGKDTRNPLQTLELCAPEWTRCLAPGGAMVIAFNANIPKRADLIAAFDGLGLDVVETDLSHRMSESILRDVLVLKKD